MGVFNEYSFVPDLFPYKYKVWFSIPYFVDNRVLYLSNNYGQDLRISARVHGLSSFFYFPNVRDHAFMESQFVVSPLFVPSEVSSFFSTPANYYFKRFSRFLIQLNYRSRRLLGFKNFSFLSFSYKGFTGYLRIKGGIRPRRYRTTAFKLNNRFRTRIKRWLISYNNLKAKVVVKKRAISPRFSRKNRRLLLPRLLNSFLPGTWHYRRIARNTSVLPRFTFRTRFLQRLIGESFFYLSESGFRFNKLRKFFRKFRHLFRRLSRRRFKRRFVYFRPRPFRIFVRHSVARAIRHAIQSLAVISFPVLPTSAFVKLRSSVDLVYSIIRARSYFLTNRVISDLSSKLVSEYFFHLQYSQNKFQDFDFSVFIFRQFRFFLNNKFTELYQEYATISGPKPYVSAERLEQFSARFVINKVGVRATSKLVRRRYKPSFRSSLLKSIPKILVYKE